MVLVIGAVLVISFVLYIYSSQMDPLVVETSSSGDDVETDLFVEEAVRREGSLEGRVYLEDDADPGDIRVKVRGVDVMTRTDENGEFVLPGLDIGEVRVSAFKDGFYGLYAKAVVLEGETVSCEIVGHRIRKAKVRWVYQPDGSKDLSGDNIVGGTSILEARVLDRVSFGQGFKQVGAYSDFLMYQKADKLGIRNFDSRSGDDRPVLMEVESSFDELIEVGEIGSLGQSRTISAGKVFVFRCFDGKHYAKMEIVEIIE